MRIMAFPAHAGMNRYWKGFNKIRTCVPRACGDEPAGGVIDWRDDGRSPRMRG